MNFTVDSQIVHNYVLLIRNNMKIINDVPNLYNLREMVALVLTGE